MNQLHHYTHFHRANCKTVLLQTNLEYLQ